MNIPIELLENILYYCSYNDINNFGMTNKFASKICNNNTFWINYVSYHYDPKKYGVTGWNNSVFNNKTINYNGKLSTWHKIAQTLYYGNVVPIIPGSEFILISKIDKMNTIVDKIRAVTGITSDFYMSIEILDDHSRSCILVETSRLNNVLFIFPRPIHDKITKIIVSTM